MTESLHPAAPHHLPAFITAPGESDVLMTVMAVVLVVAVLAVGLLFLRLHTLPERMAHKSHKLQFEIVAVLGLLADMAEASVAPEDIVGFDVVLADTQKPELIGQRRQLLLSIWLPTTAPKAPPISAPTVPLPPRR